MMDGWRASSPRPSPPTPGGEGDEPLVHLGAGEEWGKFGRVVDFERW